MNRLLKGAGVAFLLVCASCENFVESLFHQDGPHSLSATNGRGDGLKLSWSEPTTNDKITVLSYTIDRDGAFAGSSSTTSWTDSTANPATEYSYTISATLSDGSTSNDSDSVRGWFVPAKDLQLSTGSGLASFPGSAVTVDGWFETIVVKGWVYHFDPVSATELSICNHDAPWVQLSLGTASSFTWTADRTGSAWIKTGPSQDVEAWYE